MSRSQQVTPVNDLKSISIMSSMKARSAKEELAYDSAGHMHEYIHPTQILANFHWEMLEMVEEVEKLKEPSNHPILILAPRDHAKTTILAETKPLHRIGRNRSELVQLICSTSTLSQRRLGKIKSVIRHNQNYKNLFGSMYPDGDREYLWANSAIEVIRDQEKAWDEGTAERDPTVATFGIATSVEGGRATLQVYDDVVGRENSRSSITRQEVSDKFWMSFDPMLLPSGLQIIIGTRYHWDDLYAEFIDKFDSKNEYLHLRREVVLDEEEEFVEV